MKTTLPTIKFNQFKLREINELDYVSLFEVGCNKDVCKYLNWGPYKRVFEAKVAIDSFYLKRPNYGLPVGYAITIDDSLIGVIDYHNYKKLDNSVEIGFFLKKEYWNQGIMTKALKKAIDIAFNHLEVDKVRCGHIRENIACEHVILKCNFKYEEELLEQIEDKTYICKYYSIYKGDYYDK